YESSKICAYRTIKTSAFVFQTPEQYRLIDGQFDKFYQHNGCGLEVLAFRRAYQDRRQGSLQDVIERLFDYIQTGGKDVTKELHLNRPSPFLESISKKRKAQFIRMRKERDEELIEKIDPQSIPPEHLCAAIICKANDRILAP